jgi:membrane protein
MPSQARTSPLRWPAFALIQETFGCWSQDNAPRLAAALAYYAILATAPLLVISVAVADLVFAQKAVTGQLAWEIQNFVGGEAARAIQATIQSSHSPGTGGIATALSIAILIVGASSVIVELHDALNFIWGVNPPRESSWRNDILIFLKQRFFSSLIVIGAGSLLLVSLFLSAFITAVSTFFRSLLPTSEWLLHSAEFAASFFVVTLLFAAVYKLIPDVRLEWRDVVIGASVTSLLFTVGKQLIALYLVRVGLESTYGAAWGVVLLFVWIYYSAQLFFLGAEFTKVYARRYGSHISAVSVTKTSNAGPT